MTPLRSSQRAAAWALAGLLIAVGCDGGAAGGPGAQKLGPDLSNPDGGNGVTGGDGVLGSSAPAPDNGNGVTNDQGVLGSDPPPVGDQSGAPKPAGQGGSNGGGDLCGQCSTIVQCTQGEVTAAECNEACGKVSPACVSCVKGAGSDCTKLIDCLEDCDPGDGQGGKAGGPPAKNEKLCERCDDLDEICPDLAEVFPVATCKQQCTSAPTGCEPCVLAAGNDCEAISQCLAQKCQ